MNDLVSCPFNQTHKVKQFKILAHIHSCKDKKKYQPGEFITCRVDIACLYHITKRLEHESECKACLGHEVESYNPTEFSVVSEGTTTKIDLNLNDNTLLFDTQNILTSEQFYKDNNLDSSVISKNDNTIIY